MASSQSAFSAENPIAWLADMIEHLHEPSNSRLLTLIPGKQLERVFGQDMCDIGPEFLGFVGIYDCLSRIIPTHWTVVDLGCAYAPQAFFFDSHKAYVGVDFGTKERFGAHNTTHYDMPISEFVEKHLALFEQNTTFAICSYVPPWHGDNMKFARDYFKNVFTFYPAGGRQIRLPAELTR